MKEETNETTTTWTPTEVDMNAMHDNAWLNFHADAQEAKQNLDRRYARMVNHYGNYKAMPQEMKDMFRDDYAAHKAKWNENGEEQQKRFGVKEPETSEQSKQEPQTEQPKDQAQLRQEFLHKMQEQRQPKNHCLEVEL